jgi:hypothetical protein
VEKRARSTRRGAEIERSASRSAQASGFGARRARSCCFRTDCRHRHRLSLQPCSAALHWLAQTNLTQASALLDAVGGDEALAAQILTVARQSPRYQGREVLMAQILSSLKHADSATGPSRDGITGELRSLAQRLETMRQPTDTAPGIAALREQPGVTLRSDAAARSAYNGPDHWLQTKEGLLVPDGGRLRGDSKKLWSRLVSKFGELPAQRLFDAKVRGNVLSVLDVLDRVGSKASLKEEDLAALHYVAITRGQRWFARADPKLAPRGAHDFVHSLTGAGVSEFQEKISDFVIWLGQGLVMHNDAHGALLPRETTLRSLVAKIDFGKMLVPSDVSTLDVDRYDKPPSAVKIEEELQAKGYLAHLDNGERRQLQTLFYESSLQSSYTRIVQEYAATGYRARFVAEHEVWARQLTQLLSRAAERQRPSEDSLMQATARYVARHPIYSADEGRSQDLRTWYRQELRAVQRELGLPP